MRGFSETELASFGRDGYVLVPGLATPAVTRELEAITDSLLAAPVPPLEFEADTGYPGAPASRGEQGGATPRRFLGALDREPALRAWAASPAVTSRLQQVLGADLRVTRAHHNCIMVKDPRFSSDTGWHQDIRYWRFNRPELVTALLALTPANEHNGGLRFLPGSHLLSLDDGDFDEHKFFRPNSSAGRALLEREVTVEMQPGDVVFFHCLTLHAGPRNRDGLQRKSVLFTYHGGDVQPVPGTRSAAQPEWQLHDPGV